MINEKRRKLRKEEEKLQYLVVISKPEPLAFQPQVLSMQATEGLVILCPYGVYTMTSVCLVLYSFVLIQVVCLVLGGIWVITSVHHKKSHSLPTLCPVSNFEIRCDVIAYLKRVTIKHSCSIMETWQNTRFMVTRSEVRNLPCVTSHLISKLDRV